jgi:hypothetical protein
MADDYEPQLSQNQLHAREKINHLAIQLITCLNQSNTELPIERIRLLRDLSNQISYELNDLNDY